MKDSLRVKLTLEDGSVFYGKSFGAALPAAGEVSATTVLRPGMKKMIYTRFMNHLLSIFPDLLYQTIPLNTATGMQVKALMSGLKEIKFPAFTELIPELLQNGSGKKARCRESLNPMAVR